MKIPMMHSWMTARTVALMANIFAFLEALRAPAMSPMAHLLLTCRAKTIETMARSGNNRTVDRIDQTRWVGGGVPWAP